jgi:hypothetical protein
MGWTYGMRDIYYNILVEEERFRRPRQVQSVHTP